LEEAVKWSLAVRYVADAVDAPKVKKTVPMTLTQPQIASSLETSNGWMKMIPCLAITTGFVSVGIGVGITLVIVEIIGFIGLKD
jgi:hypothetical protein